jgi:hypothetical protein
VRRRSSTPFLMLLMVIGIAVLTLIDWVISQHVFTEL